VADTGADVEGAAAAVEKVQGNTTVECKDDPAQSAEKKEEKASYHYWHDKVPKGEQAAPPPEHTPIAVRVASVESQRSTSIEDFAFMDDEDVVKLYIKLEGDLSGVTSDDVELKVEQAKFDPTCSMLLHVRGTKYLHRLYAEKLRHRVDPQGCKFRISSKTNKLIITLKKADAEYWDGLRVHNSLPYRRGGGGPPR